MKPASILFAMLLIAASAAAAEAFDLTKIDRTIAKEPKYARQPYYALLVVGPNAAKRVWLVVDGEVLYVDRNGNGDLTEANERVEMDAEATKKLNLAPGEYKGVNVFNLGEVAGMRLKLNIGVLDRSCIRILDESDIRILIKYCSETRKKGWEIASLYRITEDGYAPIGVTLCRQPKDAQISYFGGPLSFQLKGDDDQVLNRAIREGILAVRIGTLGVPARNSPYAVFSPLTTSEVPADVHPVAHIEFPNKAADQPPIRLDVTLGMRC